MSTAPGSPAAVEATASAPAGASRPSTWWVVSMAAVGLLSLFWLSVLVVGRTWHRAQLDFSVYVMGAHHLVDGHLYLARLPTSPHLPFTYPPIAAVAFYPLSLLPRSGGQLTWAFLNVASLYAVIVLSLRAARPGMDRTRLLLWSLVLTGPSFLLDPVRLTFFFGQINLVLCALVLADLTWTPRIGGRTLPRGLLVGTAAAVKLVPLVFVPYLFVTRQVRAAWTALATFVAWTVLAGLLDPAQSWQYWTKYAADASRVGNPSFILNQSIQGALDRLDHRMVSSLVIDALGVVALVAGIAVSRWAWRESSPFLGVLVCATTGMIVSPITWEHHLVWAVPILLWLCLAADRPPGGWLWAAAAAVTLWWAPVERVPSAVWAGLHEHGWGLLDGQSSFALMVAFVIGIAVLLTVRRHRRSGDPVATVPPSPASTAGATT